jgi:hypothetical protein
MNVMTDTSRERSPDSLPARDQDRDQGRQGRDQARDQARDPARDEARDPARDQARGGARLELRASDADRDDAAAVLGAAMATGRLTTTEYAERLDAVYAAKTLGDLAPLTRDLPADGADPGMRVADRTEVAARFSKVIRSGRWVAGRRTRLTARFGALIVNLTDAVLPGREITLEINAFCGKLIVTVPEGAHVIDEGGALFAKRAVYGRRESGDANGPVIRLVGDARFAKVAVYRGHHDPHEGRQQWRPPLAELKELKELKPQR